MRSWTTVLVLAANLNSMVVASDDIETIKAVRSSFNEAIARHDVEAIQSFLYEDYVITVSSGSIERSRAEHGSSFAAHFREFSDVVYIRTPSEVVVSNAYPMAFENGTWVGRRTTENGRLENGGRYSAAWRKVDGAWLIYSELFVALHCKGKDC